MKIIIGESVQDSIEMMALFDKFDKESEISWLEKMFKDGFSFSFIKR